MLLTTDQLIERIAEKYDPDELVDLLRLTNDDILRAFHHRVEMYRENFASEEYFEMELKEVSLEDDLSEEEYDY